MPLDAKSTFEDIKAAYNDNASYEEQGSLLLAGRFITACRFMLNPTFLPQVTEHSGERVELFLAAVERQLKDAQDFVQEGGRGPDEEVTYVSFENSRR